MGSGLPLPAYIAAAPVQLRPFAATDAAAVAHFCGDADLALMTGLIPHPYLPGMAEGWIASHAAARRHGTAYVWAITLTDAAAIIGSIELRPAHDAVDSIGYWLGRPHRGRGYMTAALRAVIDAGFAHLAGDEWHATHLVRNPASGRVMARCGMSWWRNERRLHRGHDEEFAVRGITRGEWQRLAGTRPRAGG